MSRKSYGHSSGGLIGLILFSLAALGAWLMPHGTAAQQGNFPAGGLPSGFSSVANQIQAPNSSCAAPPYSWSGATNVGLIGANNILVACVNGASAMAWDSTGTFNTLGLQSLNTTTTCTTAATINTPCTTASITLPVGYADTNYRLSISCLGVTAFPQVQTYTKSNTTFTITLNNLTAAAATCSSFDVIATHN